MAVWMCMREDGGVPCKTALAFSVNSPCPPKMTILRLCYCMAACQISSFVSPRPATPLRRRALCLRLRD